MAGHDRPSGLRLRDALGSLAHLSFTRPFASLALVAAVTSVAALGLGSLRVDADLTRLLDDTFPSVRDVGVLKDRFGGVGYVALFVKGRDPAALRRFADDISPRLERLDSVRWVDRRRPTEFFADRGLYWADTADLRQALDRIEARRRWEHLRHNPFYVDLDESEPPSLDMSDLEAKYRRRSGTGFDEASPSGGYYTDEAQGGDGRRLVVLVKPAALASDLGFARRVVSDVQGVVDSVDRSAYGPGFDVQLTGRYVKKVDLQRTIESDLALASAAALVLVLLYVAFHFRRLSAVVLLMAPLLVGLAWTYGFAATALGTLNILAAFVGAILLGLGIDNGIHLLSRYEDEVSRGVDPARAVRAAFGQTGRAALVAAATTIAAFLVVATSQFRGFEEFGIVCAGGLSLVLLAYLVCLPALLGVQARFQRRAPSRGGSAEHRWASWLQRSARPVFWSLLAGTLLVTAWGTGVRFEYDFAALDPRGLPSYVLDEEVNRVLGRSQTPLVVTARDGEEARALAETIRRRSAALGARSGVDRVLATTDLVPPDQDEKHALLAEIAEDLAAIDTASMAAPRRGRIQRIAHMAAAAPFVRADLPAVVRRSFEPRSGARTDEFVLVFPSIALSDGARVVQLADELRDLRAPDGRRVDAAGEAMVLADVLRQVFHEAPRIVGFTLVLVTALLIVLLGSVRRGLWAAAPALLTLAVTAGVMALLGVRFNYLNVMALPVLLGVGVDGGSHLVARLSEGRSFRETVGGTSRAITGAVLTTAFGFGALLVAHHPGLASFGQVALIGLGANLLATVVLLPAALAIWPMTAPAQPARQVARGGLVHGLVTVGGTGHAPFAPGSVGALPALAAGWLLRDLDIWTWMAVLGALTVASVWLVDRYLVGRASKDPQEVVIDELVGCLIAVAFVPWELPWVIAAYVAFRLLDIVKPWPIRFFDRQVRGGLGVVGDDVLAGLIAGAALAVAHFAMTA